MGGKGICALAKVKQTENDVVVVVVDYFSSGWVRSNDPSLVPPAGICGMTLNAVASRGGYIMPAKGASKGGEETGAGTGTRTGTGTGVDRGESKGKVRSTDNDDEDSEKDEKGLWVVSELMHMYYVCSNWVVQHWQVSDWKEDILF